MASVQGNDQLLKVGLALLQQAQQSGGQGGQQKAAAAGQPPAELAGGPQGGCPNCSCGPGGCNCQG